VGEADDLNKITDAVIGAAIDVHKALGPGLLELAYQACLVYELMIRGHQVEQQKPLPIIYKNVNLDCGYRMDLVVDEKVVVELKSVESITPVHEAQILSYLRLSGMKIGLLINFNQRLLKNGLRRFVNGSLS
jgi:GxxExxY protein